MLRTGQSLHPASHPLDHTRRLHYRGPWRLPGPDSHQQAASSFSPGYTITTPFAVTAPQLLGAPPIGR
jgi:hypothetical protein